MNIVLSGLLFCKAYLDDLVVCFESWSEHMEHLHAVFYHLMDAGLMVIEVTSFSSGRNNRDKN